VTGAAAAADAPAAVPVTPVETGAPAVAVLPEPTVADVAPAAASDDAANDTIVYALLGAGAAALGIGGLAIAARRRRRIAERDVDSVPMTDRREAPAREPAVARPIPSGAPAPFAFVPPQPRQQQRMAASPRAGIGRHEAMVDYGPTSDNPFLTRKNRLRRARFLDRMEANGWLPREERRMAGAR
jgi:resuscitation-promoting factor RpfA